MTIRLFTSLVLALLAASCAPRAVRIQAPPPVAKIVAVTPAAPAVQAVERRSEKLEIRVSDTAKRVNQIEETVNRSVEDAIRKGDAEREAESKRLQSQVRELRSISEAAVQSAAELREDVDAAKNVIRMITAERDAALQEAESIRQTLTTERNENVASLSRLDEKRVAAALDAARWRKRALTTWGCILGVLLIGVGLKTYHII